MSTLDNLTSAYRFVVSNEFSNPDTVITGPGLGIHNKPEYDNETGLTINPSLQTTTDAIAEYYALPWQGQREAADAAVLASSISAANKTRWANMGSSINQDGLWLIFNMYPADLESWFMSTDIVAEYTIPYLQKWIRKLLHSTNDFPNWHANPWKFGSLCPGAANYKNVINDRIVESQETLKQNIAFVNTNAKITNFASTISTDLPSFGSELEQTGKLFNFSRVAHIGSPGELVNNLRNAGGYGPMTIKLNQLLLDVPSIRSIGSSLQLEDEVVEGILGNCKHHTTVKLADSGLSVDQVASLGNKLPLKVQRAIYEAFATLTPSDVDQIKRFLKITQPAVVNGEDLFDLTKLFPSSYASLTTVKFDGSQMTVLPVYDGTELSTDLPALSDKYINVIGEKFAYSNAAFSRSLQQVPRIVQTTATKFAQAVQSMEVVDDLSILPAYNTYVSSGDAAFWNQDFLYHAATDTTLWTGDQFMVVSDMIGSPVGYNVLAPLQNSINIYNTPSYIDPVTKNAGPTDCGILPAITYLLNGAYDDIDPGTPPTVPPFPIWVLPFGLGTYTSLDSAFTALMDYVETLLNGYASNPLTEELLRDYYRISRQIIRERENIYVWQHDEFPGTSGIAPDGILWATWTSSIAELDGHGEEAYVMERLADVSNFGGQSLVALLREVRNLARLDSIGI